MFIHIGNKKILSGNLIVGIFNMETLEKSKENEKLTFGLEENVKTVLLDEENKISTSNISSYTIIKRAMINESFVRRTKK